MFFPTIESWTCTWGQAIVVTINFSCNSSVESLANKMSQLANSNGDRITPWNQVVCSSKSKESVDESGWKDTDIQSRRLAQKEGWEIGSTCSVRRLEGEQWLPKVGKRREKSLSHVRLFVIPWTVADQVPLSMGFSRQEYWSGLPFPSPGDLPDPGLNLGLPHCRQPLYHPSHREAPKQERWVPNH